MYSLAYAAKKESVYEQIRFLKVYQQFDRYVAVPKQRAANAGWFDHGLNAIRENGVYEEIIKKWQ